MAMLHRFKQTIKMGDFFNSYQMLRYQQQTEYRTFTGGLISLGIITTIVIAFASMIIDTVNRTLINYTHSSARETDPILTTLTASAQDNFMFGVEVWGHNLNAQQRYFDVVFEQITSNYGQNYTYTKVPLVECTRQHWSLLSSVVDNYERLKVGNWMCPEIGTKIQLQGKYSSAVYKQYSITLYPCNNDTDPSRLCAPSQQIDAFLQSNGQWNYFSYYYINSIINPDQPDYKHYYLQDRSWIVFGKQLGAQFDIYVSSIDISSDNSIWPFSNMIYQEATNVDYNPILYSYTVSNDTSYANFFVMKDPNHQTYNRQVQKIFVVFSFMGGLIGAVMAGLIIMNTYTSFAFELALAIDIFKDNQTTNTHKTLRKQSKGTVNIFHFFSYSLYHILKKFKKDIDWPFIEYIQECRKEILCQLDIKGLIKRIIFLEYCISYILEDYHLSQMHNQKPHLPEDVRKLREKFQAPICQQNQQNLSEALSNQSSKHVKMAQIVPINECGLQTYEQFGTARQNDLSPQELSYKINVQQIEENSLPKLESKQENDLWKKRSINIKKLTVSAKQGNLISQKLLSNMSVHKHNELQSMMLREAKQLSLRMPNFKYGSFKET